MAYSVSGYKAIVCEPYSRYIFAPLDKLMNLTYSKNWYSRAFLTYTYILYLYITYSTYTHT